MYVNKLIQILIALKKKIGSNGIINLLTSIDFVLAVYHVSTFQGFEIHAFCGIDPPRHQGLQ